MGAKSLLGWLGKAIHWVLLGQNPFAVAGTAAATVARLVPGADVLKAIAGMVARAEAIGEIVKAQGGTPLDKMQLVLPQAAELVKASELVAGREILDEEKFRAAVQGLVENLVSLQKSVGEAKRMVEGN